MREVKPAKNYDVVSFGRAMNDDFGGRVKKLFDTETQAALDAQQTGRLTTLILNGTIVDISTVSQKYCKFPMYLCGNQIIIVLIIVFVINIIKIN